MEARMIAEMKAIQHKWDAIENERKANHDEGRNGCVAWSEARLSGGKGTNSRGDRGRGGVPGSP
jgi:hypothetical protein